MADLATITQQLQRAIGLQETSSGTAGVGATLNNPGGLKYADWEAQFGATKAASGFAKFPTLTAGWDALQERLTQMVRGGASLTSLINTYSPPSDGNSNNPVRIAQLAGITGLNPTVPIIGQATDAKPATGATGATIGDWLERVFGKPGQADKPSVPEKAPEVEYGIWGRGTALVLGLICLMAGFLLLRQTQIVVDTVRKGATKAAGLMV